MSEPLDICIDVSHWQGSIDWPAVRAAGILIAMLKATEGNGTVDPAFDRNRRDAENAGIATIPYHFLRAGYADEQARHFQSVAEIAAGSAYALDWEGTAAAAASAAEVEAIGAQLADIAGRPPLGYWGIPGSAPARPTASMLTWPRWVARYPITGARQWAALPEAVRGGIDKWWIVEGDAGARLFAQYTQWGIVPGIAGNVDRSAAFFPTPAAAVAWVRGAAPATSSPLQEIVAEAIDVLKRLRAALENRA
jgi:GH25 family lysozyme M1 (1,4-beta-N-acetylmuramidase)